MHIGLLHSFAEYTMTIRRNNLSRPIYIGLLDVMDLKLTALEQDT